MDRVCMYAAAPVMSRELGFDKLTIGIIFSSFAWGYSLFQVPAGWLADKIGPRRMLAAIVTWWSGFTALTAAGWSLSSFVAIRFLFGAGEAGAFPSATRAFSRWLATSERGFAQGVTHAGSRLAGALTHAVTAALMAALGWRFPFLLFGSLGMIWAVVWFLWYRDRPEEHPGVSPSELIWIQEGKPHASDQVPLSWKTLLSDSNIWCLCTMYFCYGYVLYIFLSWLPTYFAEVRGFGLVKSGVSTAIPLLAGTVTNSLGGWLSDRLYVRTQNLPLRSPRNRCDRLCRGHGLRHFRGIGPRSENGYTVDVPCSGRFGVNHRSLLGHSSGCGARSLGDCVRTDEHVWQCRRCDFSDPSRSGCGTVPFLDPAFCAGEFSLFGGWLVVV